MKTLNQFITENDKTVEDLQDEHDLAIRLVKIGKKEHLDKLVDYPYWTVRYHVANLGHKDHLDKLVNDQDSYVRLAVVHHGYKEHLEKLKNDPSDMVRKAVERLSNENI